MVLYVGTRVETSQSTLRFRFRKVTKSDLKKLSVSNKSNRKRKMASSPLNSNPDQRYEETSPGSSSSANAQSSSSSSVKFPQKLWNIVEDPNDTSITWTESGETLQIDLSSFQEKYLSKRATTFKTNNMASFIRQLNLYGFRKVNNQTDVHEYRHPNFRRGRSDLLKGVTRRYPNQQNSHQQVPTNDRQSHMIRDMTDPRFNSQRGDERGGTSSSFWNDLDYSGKMRFPHMSPQKVLESTSLFINEPMAASMSNFHETHVSCSQHLNLSAISPSSSSSSAHHSSSSTSRRYSPSIRDNSNNLSVPVQKFRQLLIPNNDEELDNSRMQEPLDFRKHHRRSNDSTIVPSGMMPSHQHHHQYPSMGRFGGTPCDVISSPPMFPFFPGNDAGSNQLNRQHRRDHDRLDQQQRSPFGGSFKHRSQEDDDEDDEDDEENDVINVEDLSDDDEESEERNRSEDSSYSLQSSQNPQHNFVYRNYGVRDRDEDSENQEARTDEDDEDEEDQDEDNEISNQYCNRENDDDSDEDEEEEEEDEEEDEDAENETNDNYSSRYRGMPSRGRVENRPLSAFDSVFASDTPSDSYFF